MKIELRNKWKDPYKIYREFFAVRWIVPLNSLTIILFDIGIDIYFKRKDDYGKKESNRQ